MTWRIEYQDDEFGPEWKFFADVDHTEDLVDSIIALLYYETGGCVDFRKRELEAVDETKVLESNVQAAIWTTYDEGDPPRAKVMPKGSLESLHAAGYEIVRKR